MLDFLNNVLDLVIAFLDPAFLNLWYFPIVAICFLASVPSIIRVLTSWR